MIDRLQQASDRVHLAIGKLVRRARLDEEGAVVTGQTYEASVSGSSGASPVEVGATRLQHAGELQTVTDKLEHVARVLEGLWEDLNPQPTGQQCPTFAIGLDGALVSCQGQVTHRGRCWRCHDFIRRTGRNPEAELLDEWNRRIPNECACGTDCCPDGCLDMVPPGDGTVSNRCRVRQHRARKERAAS